ncbi:MAG: zinc metallopeptidase [Candidatus Dojkabacteria bacterium]
MFVPFFDITYLIFSLPAILVGVVASLLLRYWTGKYRQQLNANSVTGVEVAERIARKHDYPIRLEITEQPLGDNYNPTNSTLTLSREIAQEKSITAVGIAAHEMGHVEQHASGNVFFRLRTSIVPIVNLGSSLGYFLLIIGIIIGLVQLAWLGIVLFSATTVFTLITLPIELDASRRALKMIRENQILFPNEIGGVKKVLTAAALTYVAATLQSFGALIYFILRVQGIGRND